MSNERVLCLWCGELFRTVGAGRQSTSSYCKRTHKVKAGDQRQIRRRWAFKGCDAPHAPSESDRGMAIAYVRANGGEIFVCKCGKYHVAEKGEGGRSPELERPKKAAAEHNIDGDSA